MTYTTDIFGLIEQVRDIAVGGNSPAVNPTVPRSEYHFIRQIATSLSADIAVHPDNTHGLLAAIRDVMGGTGSGYEDDVLGLLLEIRDLTNTGDASVTAYPAGQLGCWQAILNFVVANGFPSGGGGDLEAPPAGFAYIINGSGAYILNADGAYILAKV